MILLQFADQVLLQTSGFHPNCITIITELVTHNKCCTLLTKSVSNLFQSKEIKNLRANAYHKQFYFMKKKLILS